MGNTEAFLIIFHFGNMIMHHFPCCFLLQRQDNCPIREPCHIPEPHEDIHRYHHKYIRKPGEWTTKSSYSQNCGTWD